jgi:hypothetical protein
MGTTQSTAPEATKAKRIMAFNVLTNIGIRHRIEIQRSVTSPGVSLDNAEGFYDLLGWPSRYVKVSIPIPSSEHPQNLEMDRFDFNVLIGYGPSTPKFVNFHGPALGSANDINERVSDAIGLAKRFQNCEELQTFLRGGSGKTA